MTQRNVYATLAEFKQNQTITSTDATDDSVIEALLSRASRYIDAKTQRHFYPSIETRYYDTPDGNSQLQFDSDLLAVSQLLNGDGTTIPSSAYKLYNPNQTPFYSLALLPTSGYAWESDSSGNTEQAIAVTGVYAFRIEYSRRAWADTGATLSAAISSTSQSTFTCTTGKLTAGMIVKIDDEIMIVSSVSTSTSDTITLYARGDNGSTAATHLISAKIYQWIAQEEISQATLDIAISKYKRLYGDGASGSAQITAAGVVIMPQDVPDQAQDVIALYRRRL